METSPEMNINPEEDGERSPAIEENGTTSGESWSQESSEAAADSTLGANVEQVPDDPDEAIAWLERLAAKQGARPEELPSVESDMSTTDAVAVPVDHSELADVDAGEIPEDPDEAMAWLEMLAAKEVAGADEPVTEQDSNGNEMVAEADLGLDLVGDSLSSPLTTDLEDALDDSLPDDIDQALGWLEELTLESGIQAESAETPVEALTANEEPPTPDVAHVVDDALTGAELLFAAPEMLDDAANANQDEGGAQYEDDDEAMAWLEQLAARQGTPIEELTTLDAGPDEMALDMAPAGEADRLDLESGDEVTIIPPPTRPLPDLDAEIPDDTDLQDRQTIESEELEHTAEQEGETPLVSDSPEPLAVTEMIEPAVDEQVSAEQEPAEPLLTEPDDSVIQEPDEPTVASEESAPAGDLAWLDTLGAVDAESWLEAEAAVDDVETVTEPAEVTDKEPALELETLESEVGTPLAVMPDSPGSEALVEARQLMEQGEFNESLAQYAVLVEDGEDLPFLIDDLETLREQKGPEPSLHRVLGDAYARNGQLRKAIERYREALATL